MAIAVAIETAKSAPVFGDDFGGESAEILPRSLV